jgi:enoyl-CoA hydratase/carnithine racemase
VDDVELSIQGEMAFVRLRRPDQGNALRGVTFDALRKVGLRLQDTPPRYVLITAEGADFCTGLDPDPQDPLYALFEPVARSRDAHRAAEIVGRLRSSLETLSRLPCPVIAAIEGRCWGAGLALALVADLRIAASDATFCAGETHRGVLEGLGTLTRLAVSTGPARALDLTLTRRVVTAQEFAAMGLVSRVVAPGEAMSQAIELAHELKRQGTAARQQTLLTLRSMLVRLEKELGPLETEGAARAWVSGEFVMMGAPRE